MKRISSLGALLLLLGCQATQGPEEVPLTDLLITDGTTTQRYVDVIQPTKEPEWWMSGLPLASSTLHINTLQDDAEWMRAFNFDGDYSLTRQEMTQAWLVQTARWKTGTNYQPKSLMVIPKTAALQLTQVSPQALQGIAISVDDERVVRSVVDEMAGGATATDATRTAAQQAIQDAVEGVNESFASSGGGGGDGGGGSSGGGSDGGGSGGSGGSSGSI